jgi:hypothetical protein
LGYRERRKPEARFPRISLLGSSVNKGNLPFSSRRKLFRIANVCSAENKQNDMWNDTSARR